MLTSEQVRRVLREQIAPYTLRARALVIEDRTGLLRPAVGDGMVLTVADQEWFVLSSGPILHIRRRLWEQRADRVALVVPPDAPLSGLRDLTSAAAYVPAGGAHVLKVLADVHLPDDTRLDPLAAILLERPAGLALLRSQEITRAALPRAVVSALLGEDLLQASSDAAALARILRSELSVPESAYELCREYAATLSAPYQPLVAGLLTFGHSRALVAQALLQADISRREGQVSSDPLVVEFLEHTAVNDVALLEAFAMRLEEALLAEPNWGRDFVRRFPRREITHASRILPAALEADFRRQLDDLVAGRRTAVDDRLWREHLFYEEYKHWVVALGRLALLSHLCDEIERLLANDADLPDLVQAYVERISAGDLAWMELGELAKKVIPLRAEIDQLRQAYQKARTALNRIFAEAYAAQYPHLFGGSALPLVVHLLPKVVKPRLDTGEQVLVVIVDGLGYHLWQRFRSDLIAGGWQLEDGYALALLPTVTAVSRYAIFSGPVAKRLYPDLAEPDDDAPAEDELKALTALFPNRSVAVYKKRELKIALDDVVASIRGQQHDLIVVVINEVDEALRSPAHAPFSLHLDDYAFLNAVLNAARGSRRSVFLVADHGFTPDGDCKWPVPSGAMVAEARLARVSQPADNDADVPGVWCKDLVYELGGPFLALYDFGGRFKPQPNVGYHSGVSLEEVVVPAAWLKVGAVAPTLDLRFVDVPAQVTEDEEVLVTIELLTSAGAPGEVRVEVWIPNQPPVIFSAEPQAGLPFQRWQIPWRPTLPPREPVEPQTARLRAIVYCNQTEAAHAEAEVTIRPRPGKYESAVAALLP
ncbi:MAG TPA: PglZ domain-containing protein [Caldilineae bacterium]|nr:PglZ domain-containing protein [Caldilineae bacterium]